MPSWTEALLDEAVANPGVRVELPAGAHGNLRLSSDTSHVSVFPLVARDDRHGLLVTAASAPFSPILVQALHGLAANVSLALGSVALTDQALEHQAFHDALTGLPNRVLFSDRIAHALTVAARQNTGIAVILLDLDDFKTINDGLGHATGDEVLQQVAARLLECAAVTDTAARLGGDEFAILLENVADPVTAIEAAELLVGEFERSIKVAGKQLLVRPSIGIALSGMQARHIRSDAGELLRNADAAMYICKREGKGGFRVFETAMHERVLERLELRAELQRAVDGSQFELHYQPVASLGTGRVSGMEALIRWHHPTRGFVQPDQFIPLAEEMGLIVQIGSWVLREACRQTVEMHENDEVDPDFVLGVNLSVKQLQHPDVIADVRAALEESRLAPHTLVLEITETVVMADSELARVRIQQLKDLGVSVAMDDFGTGYSSLGFLSRLPVDILKLDRSFLAANATPDASGLTAAIIALGGTLGLRVVAEGIETAAQYEALRELGCDFGQGFYIARPMSFAATREWLAGAERTWRAAQAA